MDKKNLISFIFILFMAVLTVIWSMITVETKEYMPKYNQTTYSIHSKGEPAYAEFIDPQTGVHYLRNENNVLVPRYNNDNSIMRDK